MKTGKTSGKRRNCSGNAGKTRSGTAERTPAGGGELTCRRRASRFTDVENASRAWRSLNTPANGENQKLNRNNASGASTSGGGINRRAGLGKWLIHRSRRWQLAATYAVRRTAVSSGRWRWVGTRDAGGNSESEGGEKPAARENIEIISWRHRVAKGYQQWVPHRWCCGRDWALR